MLELSRHFSTDGFMPHGMCCLWRPAILAVHVGSDALIALVYCSVLLLEDNMIIALDTKSMLRELGDCDIYCLDDHKSRGDFPSGTP